MGEYAKYNGVEIKIGTFNRMYYLRYDQRNKVKPMEGNIDPTKSVNLIWRLPFKDEIEENVAPGSFTDFDRGYKIRASVEKLYKIITTLSEGCILQVNSDTPDKQVLVNVQCSHGVSVKGEEVSLFWRDTTIELQGMVNFVSEEEKEPLLFFVCSACGASSFLKWDEKVDFILKEGLTEDEYKLMQGYYQLINSDLQKL